MKCGVFVAFSCFIVLLMDVKMAGSIISDCVLIIEGKINRIMVPQIRLVLGENDDRGDGITEDFEQYYWQTVMADGSLDNETLEEDGDTWKLSLPTVDAVIYELRIERDCPIVPFSLYSGGNTIIATGHVARSPLNTLCRPQLGTITNAGDGVVTGVTINSLYDCATKVFDETPYAKGVQFQSGVCKAFYGLNAQLVPEEYSSDPSLACILQCNKLPFKSIDQAASETEVDDFDECEDMGITENARSVSLDVDESICRLYNTEIQKEISPTNKHIGCYIGYTTTTTATPPTTTPPATTTTTPTTTTTTKPATKSKTAAIVGAVVGTAGGASAAVGGAYYVTKSLSPLDWLSKLSDLFESDIGGGDTDLTQSLSAAYNEECSESTIADLGIAREQLAQVAGYIT